MLNNWFLGDADNEAEYEKAETYIDSLPLEEKQKVIEKSWECIFDIKPFENEWRRSGYYVQATFWELRKKHVVSARKFIGHQK